jgi:hypothetical protein
VRELVSGGAGDLQEVDMKLFRGLARAEKGRRWGAACRAGGCHGKRQRYAGTGRRGRPVARRAALWPGSAASPHGAA